MADIDTLDSSVPVSQEGAVNGSQEQKGPEGSSNKAADEVAAGSKSASPTKDAAPALPSPGSGLVPLRGSAANGSSPGAPSGPTISMPHPKKFSHSDINKRFLEKNSPASGAIQTPSTPSINKPGSAIQKPALQTASSHSRLVTAKLTAEGPRSTITGPGWSRPPSTSSSSGPAQPVGTTSKPSPGPTPGTTPAAVPPPPGKIIQPQPRGFNESGTSRRDNATRPAWGAAAKAPSAPISSADLSQDFPTAAEVAQVRSAKILEKKHAAEEATAHKEALAAEADAFRGVHLAPNVHHWDEDEGDDSNFLDEVIEFDDGRQYTIPQQAEQTSDKANDRREGETQDQPVRAQMRLLREDLRTFRHLRHLQYFTHHRIPPACSSTNVQIVSSLIRLIRKVESTDHRKTLTSQEEGVVRSQQSGPPEDGGPHRHRGFGDHANYGSWNDSSRPRDRDMSRRDYAGSSHMSRTFSQGFDHNRSRDHYNPPGGMDRPRRYSNMGGPPSEALSSDAESRDGRQLPPHLSGSYASSSEWRTPSESGRPPLASLPADAPLAPKSNASRSPAVSHASLSPLHVETPLLATPDGLPVSDVEEARKAAMHNAAERARLRRRHEEEEREKEKERARKKAAEIEAKMKAAEAAKHPQPVPQEEPASSQPTREAEAKAVEFIEQAISSVAPSSRPAEDKAGPAAQRPPSMRTPSLRGDIRPPFMKRASSSVNGYDSALDEVDSWRTKPAPSKPPQSFDARPHISTSVSQPPAPPPPELPLLHEVASLHIDPDESLEVVDFADHGKLVGAYEEPSNTPSSEERPAAPTARPPRPVAMDFFEDKQQSSSSTSEGEGSWRRRSSIAEPVQPPVQPVVKDKPILEITPAPYESSSSQWKGHVPSDSLTRLPPEHTQANHNHVGVRSPTTPSYREAPMSTLNDTMARIKGALDGMHHKVEPQKKWTQPAPREQPVQQEKPSSRHEHDEHIVHEVFDVTASEPPRSPKPAWNNFAVRMPRIAPRAEPVSAKKLRTFGAPYARLDVWSFVPPISGMHRWDFNLNEYLFRRPFMNKGQIRYIVKLPGQRFAGNKQALKHASPVVNLPANGKPPGFGAFGRPSEADGVASWRKASVNTVNPTAKSQRSDAEGVPTLDTVSRSPPPTQKLPEKLDVTASVAVPATAKARTQPKLPEGSSVAFYRDSRVNSGESQARPTVNFIVSSELEEDKSRLNGTPDFKEANGVVPVPQVAPATSGLITSTQEIAIIPESCSSVNDPIVEFHKSSHSVGPSMTKGASYLFATFKPIHAPITPKTQTSNLPWSKSPKDRPTKDPASRAAEADHIKTVWQTTANQIDKSSATTLETFPTHEAKAEAPVTPSTHVHPKISLSDVTRSFQQVPVSHGNTNSTDSTRNGNPTSPPSLRQPTQIAQAQPMMPVGMRPAYPGYPSPMMSSPSPSMMYAQAMTPSPIPRPMVPAGSPQYAPAPMWVPMPPPGMPASMMRPMASPYGPQLMPYPPTAQMYAPPMNMQSGNPAQPNGGQARPPGILMSPVAGQAQPSMPMYATSPVLMPAMPAMQGMHGPGAYPGTGTMNGRGQQPQRGPYENAQGMMPPGSYGAQPPPAYSTAPPNSYVRSGW
ncbi:hypothetical protein EIP86_000171 [Pleurotus ostreatoroseus]|nr:hypothetical protein EIP86_000171 [Pleurotus ostreatoroseus]